MGYLKSILFVLVIISGIGAAPLMVEAQLGNIIGSLLGLIRIQGTVFCTANGNMGINGTATPTFPDASVQLQCGNGNIVSTTTTNNMGTFSMLLSPLQVLLSVLIEKCNIVVNTPLSNCNATFPSIGSLSSSLDFVGKTIEGILNIMNVVPNGFQFLTSR